jgi:serpin B
LAVDLIADVTMRNTSPGANGEAVNAVVAGTNEFATRFFKTAVGEPKEDAVIGNYSLSAALLLTMAGTNGATTDDFAELLGVAAVDPEELHPAVNAIDLILEGRAGEGLELATANKIFVQNGLDLRDEFLDIAVGSYGAPVTAVDFMGAPEEVVTAVNDWVADTTHGFIERLTDGYSLNTVVVLANAMYLKASWAVQFHRLDEPSPFTTMNGEVVEVEMMAHDEYLPLNNGDDFVAVELPYVGGNLSLVVIQPADLAEFEADLTAARLQEITDGLVESGVHLTMPIWSTKTNVEALDPLHAIGLPTEYDFSAMIDGGSIGYFIDSISHVARIDVDETGTTAGAATDVAIAASHGPTVMIDHPFFYIIRDRGSGAILFMGHVTDPTQSG